MRKTKFIQINDIDDFKVKLLSWAQQFEVFAWMDSNDYQQKYTSYDAILAIGVHNSLLCNCKNSFEKLSNFRNNISDFIFGYFAYDLKNDIEDLTSKNFDGLDFPDMYFFQPKKIFLLKGNTLEIRYLSELENEIESDLKNVEIQKDKYLNYKKYFGKKKNQIKQRISKEKYVEKLESILNHINRGDIYELNFCQEFFIENEVIDPLLVYQKLNEISKPPFATFFKINDKFLLSASPERFAKKQGNRIISQPIKGTARRLVDRVQDKELAKKLFHDPKERAENIMIVDLVRNDLSKTAIQGSVKVEELCKVYSFKQVHQLISTVVSEVDISNDSVEIIKSLFPMGSMTGAPKISAMKIIEEQEESKRGLYSGAVGYFTPEDDFDFNVVIRSILFNQANKYISFTVGGAITSKSIIANEYEECMIKAKAMKNALGF